MTVCLSLAKMALMEQDVNNIAIDDRGRHWKGITIYNATKFMIKTSVLMNKNVFEYTNGQ
jgi:hypothetical protein